MFGLALVLRRLVQVPRETTLMVPNEDLHEVCATVRCWLDRNHAQDIAHVPAPATFSPHPHRVLDLCNQGYERHAAAGGCIPPR